MQEQLENFDERELDRIAGDHPSMTPAERAEPEDHQRLAPAAHRQRLRRPGLRRQPAVDRFFEARKMMTQMASGGGMPGMPGMPGVRRRQEGRAARRPRQGQGQGASPATRPSGPQQEREPPAERGRASAAPAAPFGLAAGAGADFDPPSLDARELPPGLREVPRPVGS